MRHKSYVIRKKHSVSEVLGITGKMEIMVGMRLHSLVFAVSRCVPVVGLVYEPKVNSFLKYIGQETASAGSVKSIEYENLKALVESTWNNREKISGEIDKVVVRLKEKALVNAELAVGLMRGSPQQGQQGVK